MRRRGVITGLALLIALAGGLTLGYRWVTTATPVTSSEALRQFHEPTADPRSSATPIPPKTAEPHKPAPVSEVGTPRPTTPLPSLRPDPGVYTWRTEGFEEAMGIRRSFPPESQRVVHVQGEGRYSYHHLYSEEHEQWFEGRLPKDQVAVPHVRERVVFGPFDAEIEIDFAPPMVFVNLPFRVGQTWEGQWSGDTYGTYAARSFERSVLTVEERDIDVWGIELRIQMHGEVEGRQDLRAWIAPEHRTTVREEYIVSGRLRGEPGSYHGEWTISLTSLTPTR